MKKTIRILTSLLVLLALLVSLPISAMAEEEPEPITGIVETNTESNVIIGSDGVVGENTGDNVTNHGSVTNNGTEDGGVNSGCIEKNEAVPNAEDTGYQENTGYVKNNYGTVSNNGIEGKGETSGTVDNNYGTIGTNYGTVTDNKEGSEIYKNAADGLVTTNDGTVVINNGTIGTNEDSVFVNGGTFENEETGEYEDLEGTITTNNGSVQENGTLGKIEQNNGQVMTNFGEVTNKSGGEVVFNEGTVDNEDGGKIYEYKFEGNSDEESEITPSKTITEAGTYYGVGVDKEDYSDEALEAETWAFALLQKKQGEALDLRNIFTKTGYEVIGYMQEGKPENSTTYNVDKPGFLSLIWGKIKEIIAPAPAESSSAPEVKPAAIPTTVAAEDVKVGTTVRAKGQVFKIIEMDDDSMTIVTMGKLSKKDMADLKAFLSKYFTPEQMELLMGEPELISGELAEKLFGGNTGHIVFKAAKNLFA